MIVSTLFPAFYAQHFSFFFLFFFLCSRESASRKARAGKEKGRKNREKYVALPFSWTLFHRCLSFLLFFFSISRRLWRKRKGYEMKVRQAISVHKKGLFQSFSFAFFLLFLASSRLAPSSRGRKEKESSKKLEELVKKVGLDKRKIRKKNM